VQRCLSQNPTLAQLLAEVLELSTWFARKDILTLLEMPPSKQKFQQSLRNSLSIPQEKFERCHVEAKDYQVRKTRTEIYITCFLV